MNTEKKLVPKRRFQEFQKTDAWEQRKLGEWGTFYYGHSCPKWSITADATTPCIRYGELYTKFGAKIEKVFSHTNMPTDKLRFSKGTEVLIPRVGEDPMDYNHCTWLSIPNVAIGEMISVFNTEQNPLFSATMFNATLQKEFASRVEGGSVTNLYYEKLKNIDVLYPTIKEQEKIAAYFEHLDNLITLHQRKLEKMKNMKAAYLTEMFPQKGETVPKRRFAGFTDAWEQRKLEDGTCKIGDGLHGTPRYSKTGNVFFINGNNFVDGNIVCTEDTKCVTEQEQSIDDKALNENTILMSINGTIGNLAFYRGEKVMLGKSAAYITVRDFDKKYLYSYLQTSVIKKHFINNLTGTTIKNLGLKTIRETQIFTPSIEEQEKIGTFFSSLDNLITLHQRKLEKLKSIKQAYLSEMFI